MDKKVFGCLASALALFFIFSMSVLSWAEEGDFKLCANFDFKSQHISAGGFNFNDPALVSAAGFGWRGLSVQTIYFSKTLGQGNEHDQADWIVADYSWYTTSIRRIDWSIGWALEDGHRIFDNDGGEDFYDYFLEAAVPWEIIPGKFILSPFVKAEFYTPVNKGAGGSGGSYTHLGVKTVNKFERFSIVQRAAVLIDSGVYSADSGQLFRYVGRLNWPLCSFLTLSPALEMSIPLSSFSDRDGRESELAGWLGFYFVF